MREWPEGGRLAPDFAVSAAIVPPWETMSDLFLLLLIIVLLLCLVVTVGSLLLYSGVLSDIVIKTGPPPIRNVTIAYKFKEGPYKDCGAAYTESCSIGPKLNAIGVFYDDPKQVRPWDVAPVTVMFNYTALKVYLHLTPWHNIEIQCTLLADKILQPVRYADLHSVLKVTQRLTMYIENLDCCII